MWAPAAPGARRIESLTQIAPCSFVSRRCALNPQKLWTAAGRLRRAAIRCAPDGLEGKTGGDREAAADVRPFGGHRCSRCGVPSRRRCRRRPGPRETVSPRRRHQVTPSGPRRPPARSRTSAPLRRCFPELPAWSDPQVLDLLDRAAAYQEEDDFDGRARLRRGGRPPGAPLGRGAPQPGAGAHAPGALRRGPRRPGAGAGARARRRRVPGAGGRALHQPAAAQRRAHRHRARVRPPRPGPHRRRAQPRPRRPGWRCWRGRRWSTWAARPRRWSRWSTPCG